jgi:hypothetical protein
MRQAKDESSAAAAERSRRGGGGDAVVAAAELLGTFRERNLSQGDQSAVLASIGRLRDKGLISGPVGEPDTFPIPLDLRTLTERGEAALPSTADVLRAVYAVDVSDLRQLQREVVIAVGDLPMLIQDLLEDRRIPSEDWFIEGPFRKYYNRANEEVIGPEMWQGSRRMRAVYATAPAGAAVLCLNVWSDAVVAQSGDLYPFRITLANLANRSRSADSGSRLGAMMPVIKIRKPRGSKRHERLAPYQIQVKGQSLCDAPAVVLAQLDALASSPQVHHINGQDVEVFYRLCLYLSDKKEETDVLGLRKDACPRCFGYATAIDAERAEGRGRNFRDKHFAHLRVDFGSRCPTAAARTPEAVLRHQLRLTLAIRSAATRGAKKAAEKEARKLGIRLDAETQLNRLRTLIPWETGGIYSAFMTDFLHVFGLGVVRVFLKMVDIFICREAIFGEKKYSYEDCRHEVEEMLSKIPHMATPNHFLKPFRLGWWSEEMGMVSADDYLSFFQQVLFVYVGNTCLLPDAAKRKALAQAHGRLFNVYRQLTTPRKSFKSTGVTLILFARDLS